VFTQNHGIPAVDIADAVGLTPEKVERAYALIDSKRAANRYLHLPAVLVRNLS